MSPPCNSKFTGGNVKAMTEHHSKTDRVLAWMRGNTFWVCVLLVAAGSVGCLGYAGIQLKSTDEPPSPRHDHDGRPGEVQKLRSPIYFERTTPTSETILST